MFYKVIEKVGGGLFFPHEGIYTTAESAQKVIDKFRSSKENMRVALYEMGGWGSGPVFVEIV